MRVENQALLEEFYEKNKDKYPGMTLEQVKLCCTTPFVYTRKMVESGDCPTVRLKYLGTFLVHPNRAKVMLIRMKKAFEALTLDAKKYFTKKLMLETFLKKHDGK